MQPWLAQARLVPPDHRHWSPYRHHWYLISIIGTLIIGSLFGTPNGRLSVPLPPLLVPRTFVVGALILISGLNLTRTPGRANTVGTFDIAIEEDEDEDEDEDVRGAKEELDEVCAASDRGPTRAVATPHLPTAFPHFQRDDGDESGTRGGGGSDDRQAEHAAAEERWRPDGNVGCLSKETNLRLREVFMQVGGPGRPAGSAFLRSGRASTAVLIGHGMCERSRCA